jgi:AcrR family transcriptional regulator
VIAEVGISKTAFYKHFESKEDLMLAALDMQHHWAQDAFRTVVAERGGDTVAGQLRSLFDLVGEISNSDEFQGCFFVNAAMEFPLQHEPAHVAAARFKRSIEDFVHDLAARAGAADPRQMARELCMIIDALLVAAGQRRQAEHRCRPAAGRVGDRRPLAGTSSLQPKRLNWGPIALFLAA